MSLSEPSRRIARAERALRAEEKAWEQADAVPSVSSDYGKRGGVPKADRVDIPHSKFIAAGGFHSLAVDDEGLMWTWGRNEEGQLGLGDREKRDVLDPKNVSLENVEGKQMRQVVCGVRSSAAVDERGQLWTWGEGKSYLGHHEDAGFHDLAVPRVVQWPSSLDGVTIKVAQVSLGWSHTVILDDAGNVYTWGFGGNGRLGHGDEQTRVAPKLVAGVPKNEIAAVAAGGAFTLARSKSGVAVAWGAGHCSGQGEEGSPDDLLIPEVIPKTLELDVTAVAAGGLHAALLTRGGSCYTWGWGECGQLGLGRRISGVVREPTPVDTEDQRITMVACGAYHTALVEEGGELMTFGAGGKRWVHEVTDSRTPRASTSWASEARSPRASEARSPRASVSRTPRASQPGRRDKQGFTKEEREQFNMELAAKAMNFQSATSGGVDETKKAKEGYKEYVISRREKIPDGTLEFKKYLKELEKEENRAKRIREVLKLAGETDDEIREREEREREEEWDRRMEMWWRGLMVWVAFLTDKPKRIIRRIARCCCVSRPKTLGDIEAFEDNTVVRSEAEMARARELDGQHGEMCRLGFAGTEEMKEDGAGDRLRPRVVTGPWRLRAGCKVIGVSCGPYHTLAVTESGEVYAFGVGLNGRLGLGDEQARSAPTHIVSLSKRGVSVGHPGRRMGISSFVVANPFDEPPPPRAETDAPRGQTQSERDASALRKLNRTGAGRIASLPNRGRLATLKATASGDENGVQSPPPDLNEDEIEALAGTGKKNRMQRRTVIDDILGSPTLGLPKL